MRLKLFFLFATSLFTNLNVALIAIDTEQSLIENNWVLGLELYSQIKQTEKPLLFSPYGVANALALVFLGARQETEQQMARILGFPLNQKNLHLAFSDLNNQLIVRNQKLFLRVANGLWLQNRFPLTSLFLKEATQFYDAKISAIDFQKNSKEAADEIIHWIKDVTQEIPSQVPLLSPMTQIFLSNCVFLKAHWAQPFNPKATESQLFFINDEKSISIDMMHRVGNYRLLKDADFALLEIPFVVDHSELACYIVLPKEKNGLKDLEKKLSYSFLLDGLNRMQERTTKVFLPKLFFQNQLSLKSPLRNMGLKIPFTVIGDFSGINGKSDLFLSQFIQYTFTSIDEYGMNASPIENTTSFPIVNNNFEEFRADHPFLFFIKDNKTDVLLFMGKVTKL